MPGSEATMKRIDYEAFYQISADFSQAEVRKIMPMLVPVERCKHGNIYRHIIDRPDKQGFIVEWCPGAGIGDNG